MHIQLGLELQPLRMTPALPPLPKKRKKAILDTEILKICKIQNDWIDRQTDRQTNR